MQPPASQNDFSPARRERTPLAAPIPAGSSDNTDSAAAADKRLAVAAAPVIETHIAAPDYPPPMPPEKKPLAKPFPVLLSILPSGVLQYRPQGSRFETIAAQTLDNAGTSDDGFDEIYTPVVTAFGEDAPALASLSAGLTDAAFTPGEFSGTVFTPITSDIADFQAGGDDALGGTASSFGSDPIPGTPTPPGSSGVDANDSIGGGNNPRSNQGTPAPWWTGSWAGWGKVTIK